MQSAAKTTSKGLLRNVLIIRKTPRYERLKDNAAAINHPYVQNVLINGWIDAYETHLELVSTFGNIIGDYADNFTIKKELDMEPDDFKDRSLVISLGGDGCLLRTSSNLYDPNLPILGINTDPQRSLGVLCGKFLYKKDRGKQRFARIFKQLEQEQFEYVYRQRFEVEVKEFHKYDMQNPIANGEKLLSLNEVFFSQA